MAAADWLRGACVGRAGPAGNRLVAGAPGGAPAGTSGATWAELSRGPGPGLVLWVRPGRAGTQGAGGTGRSWTCGVARLGADPELVPRGKSRAQGAPEPEAEE